MKILKVFFSGITLSFAAYLTANAQQLPVFSQYKQNAFLYNPAVASVDGQTLFTFISRKNWMGFKGAPGLVALGFQHRFSGEPMNVSSGLLGNKRINLDQKGRVGIGGFVFSDKNGPVSRNGVQMAYSYYIPMGESTVSFGMAAMGFVNNANKDEIKFLNNNEPAIGSMEPSVSYDMAIGAFYSMSNKIFAGISCMQILKTFDLSYKNEYFNEYLRHFYIIGGYRHALNDELAIEPSLYMKVNNNNFQTDINTRLYFKSVYWAGLSYRTNNDLVLMGGANLGDFYVGYSFDYGFGEIIKTSFGSHEINFGYAIN